MKEIFTATLGRQAPLGGVRFDESDATFDNQPALNLLPRILCLPMETIINICTFNISSEGSKDMIVGMLTDACCDRLEHFINQVQKLHQYPLHLTVLAIAIIIITIIIIIITIIIIIISSSSHSNDHDDVPIDCVVYVSLRGRPQAGGDHPITDHPLLALLGGASESALLQTERDHAGAHIRCRE